MEAEISTTMGTGKQTAPEMLVRRAMRTETISDYQAFLEMEPAWGEAVRAAGIDHPFLEHCWVRTWWECFGAGSALHIVVVKEGDEIVAIAPLILTPIRMFGISVRRLGFFYNAHVPRAGFIVTGRSEGAYQAIWDHLRSERDSWDLLQLCQLPDGSATLQEMLDLAGAGNCPHGVWVSGASPSVLLKTTWREYYDELATKHRSNLRNRTKRLNQAGSVELETVTEEECLVEAALDAGLRLEESAWKGDAGTSISCDPQVRRFYETFALRAAERQWLRLNFLRAGDQRVAFDYSLAYNNQVFLMKLGYDPAFSAYSPSNLLLSMALERAFEQGLEKYDFLGETADWKRCWTKESTANYWLFAFAGTAKGRWLHFVKFRIIPWWKKNGIGSRVRAAQPTEEAI
jgi:CelD/BcsL family acetyltransferase involved in cellulose biosynthesis